MGRGVDFTPLQQADGLRVVDDEVRFTVKRHKCRAPGDWNGPARFVSRHAEGFEGAVGVQEDEAVLSGGGAGLAGEIAFLGVVDDQNGFAGRS